MEHDPSNIKAFTELQQFLKKSHNRLENILNKLQWSKDKILQNFNTNSAASDVPQPQDLNKLKAEVTTTTTTTNTRAKNISSFPPSCSTSNSVVLDTEDLHKLLGNGPSIQAPQNFQELQSNFSREEKLQIYEYVIANTKKITIPNANDRQDSSLQSFSEILAQKRKEKRKKRKHRVSKPTYNEEIRALIDLQMQALEQYLCQKSANSIPTVSTNDFRNYSINGYKRNSSSTVSYREYANKTNNKINSNIKRTNNKSKRRSPSPEEHFRNPKKIKTSDSRQDQNSVVLNKAVEDKVKSERHLECDNKIAGNDQSSASKNQLKSQNSKSKSKTKRSHRSPSPTNKKHNKRKKQKEKDKKRAHKSAKK